MQHTRMVLLRQILSSISHIPLFGERCTIATSEMDGAIAFTSSSASYGAQIWNFNTSFILILSLFYSQWNTLCSDVEIDDSRARKVLGYRNRFTNADTVSEALWQEVLECSDGKE